MTRHRQSSRSLRTSGHHPNTLEYCDYSLGKFRRTCALVHLCDGANVLSGQHLLGFSDLAALCRYLAQTEQDVFAAYETASPMDSLV